VNGWRPGPLKHWLALNESGIWGLDPTGYGDTPVIRSTDIRIDGSWDLSDVADRELAPVEVNAKRLAIGDLVVVTSSGSAEHLGKAAIVNAQVTRLEACFANFVQRLRTGPQTDPRFVWYLLNSLSAKSEMEALGRTTTGLRNLNGGILGSITFPGPSLTGQQAIADYLDTETARIDALITKKRALADALSERFDSAVFALIARGLEGATTRPSGLEWVDHMPSHWSTPPVSANFDVQLGKMLDTQAQREGFSAPYLRNKDVQWDEINLDSLATMPFLPADMHRLSLRSGDVLVCEGGEVGRAAVVESDIDGVYYQKAVHRLRARNESNPRYLMYCLWAAAKQNVFVVEANLSTIPHLTAEQLKMHRFPWPPVDEQREIVRTLDEVRVETEAVNSRLDRQVELLNEHRQALITAAVTGEFEVPGAA